MRIAVTTFFQSQTNYGQLLQAFALQQVLMRMGHFPYIIRYGFHKPFPLVLSTEPPQCCMDKLLSDKQVEVRKAGSKEDRFFDEFRQKHLNLSENAYNHLEELQLMPPIAECYITGSDQVWAQLLSCEDNQTFFLNFGPKEVLRIAYAPSFALQNYPEDLNDRLSQNLKRFQAVSVREKTGVDICRKAGFDAQWVVDPTMFLDGEYYRKLASESRTELPTNYMLVYHVNVARQDFQYWNKFCSYNSEHNIQAVGVHANGENQPDVEFLENAEYCYPSIQDWIRLIDGSKYVLTTSFHGMIFSILLHKPFFVGLRPEGMFAGNDRIVTILKELGLQNRIITQDMNLEELTKQPICWEEVDEKVKVLRLSSLAFLEKNLSRGKVKHYSFQAWQQFILERWSQYVVLKNTEIEKCRQQKVALQHQVEPLQQQMNAMQHQIETIQAEKETLIESNAILIKKRKKYKIFSFLLSLVIILQIVLLLIIKS